ncbi:hypothetical protein [Fibrella forsythiae]|uniref:Uncharacterized protein n=1 Tax=Fibrella forsythiae TaxID=2817061 RepID=A0ABS3JNS5_9BACT|nr:hypothetical protein [Fibrella forsythiae]MBO0951656.1 hypothetical protein [Fibrella forsythiae]
METTTYLRIDPEDLDDVLTKIEQSYSITFGTNDLRQVETFGQLCEAITEKIQLADVEDCTSQQAFYKLRQGIVDVLHMDRQAVRPTTELATLFPKSTRRAAVQQLEQQLGFSFRVLLPNQYITFLGFLLISVSLIALKFSTRFGLAGVIGGIGILSIGVIIKSSWQFTLHTVGELSEKLAREHYTKVRRDSCTVNKREVADQIKQVFCTDLGIPADQLKPDSLF